MKVFIYQAIETAKEPAHVHATMFVKDELYKVKRGIDDTFVSVEGRFKNKLGGFEYKCQSLKKYYCKKYLVLKSKIER